MRMHEMHEFKNSASSVAHCHPHALVAQYGMSDVQETGAAPSGRGQRHSDDNSAGACTTNVCGRGIDRHGKHSTDMCSQL